MSINLETVLCSTFKRKIYVINKIQLESVSNVKLLMKIRVLKEQMD